MIKQFDPESESELVKGYMLEEYKLLVKERRFVMTRFIQAVALYMALCGFAVREVIVARSVLILVLVTLAFTFLTPVALYAARKFRNMYSHGAQRESLLAAKLCFGPPYPLLWGYRAAVVFVLLAQSSLITVALIRYLLWELPPTMGDV